MSAKLLVVLGAAAVGAALGFLQASCSTCTKGCFPELEFIPLGFDCTSSTFHSTFPRKWVPLNHGPMKWPAVW